MGTFCRSLLGLLLAFGWHRALCIEQRCFENGPWTANRSHIKLRMISHQWASHELSTFALQIVLQEFLGYSVELVAPSTLPAIDFLEAMSLGLVDGDVENWQAIPGVARYEEYIASPTGTLLDVGPVGYGGRSGLFVAGPLARQDWSSEYYKTYRNFTHVTQAGVRTFSQSDLASHLGENARECPHQDFEWCGTPGSEFEGFYATPFCQEDPSSCFEIVHATPFYDTGYFEALVRTYKVPATFAYFGASDFTTVLRERVGNGESVITYLWEPTLAVPAIGALRISFPDNFYACEAASNFSITLNPNAGDLPCDYGERSLRKVMRKALYDIAPEAYYFIERAYITKAQLDTMLADVIGGMTNSGAACAFVKSQLHLLREWAPPCITNPPVVVQDGDEVFQLSSRTCQNVTVHATRSASISCGLTPLVNRSHTELRLVRRNWLSHDIVSMLAEVVLRDVLGYKIMLVDVNGTSDLVLQQIEAGYYDVDMEHSGVEANIQAYANVHALGPTGYSLRAGIYIPRRALQENPMSDYYRFFQNISSGNRATGSLLLHSEAEARNLSFQCHWCNGATSGNWIPPQCLANPGRCLELVHRSPFDSPGYIEQLVRNLDLDVVVGYYGEHMQTALRQYQDWGKATPFYWWEPDPFVVAVDAVRVSFPDHSLGCSDYSDFLALSPAGSTSCDFPEALPLKVMARSFQEGYAWSEAVYLLKRLQLATPHLKGLLRQHIQAGGSRTSEDLVCDFIADGSRVAPYRVVDWAPLCISTPTPSPIRVNDTIFSYASQTCEIVSCPAHQIVQEITGASLDASGNYFCASCPPMQVPSPRQDYCMACEFGYEVDDAGIGCRACSAGNHSSPTTNGCAPCSPGGMTAKGAASTCTQCPPGRFQDEYGATECRECPAGHFSEESGLSACLQCRSGTYHNSSGQSAECTACAVGTFAQARAATSCTECSFGTTLLLGATDPSACVCGRDFFEVEGTNGSRQCRACSQYMEGCAGGSTQPLQRRGFHISADGLLVYRCASTEACPGGALGWCPEGSSGPGCASCNLGTYFWDAEKCAKCNGTNNALVAIVPLVLIGTFFVIHKFGNDPLGKSLSSSAEFLVLIGLSLNVFLYMSAFHAIDINWKEPISWIIDLSSVISSAELLSLPFTCSTSLQAAGQFALSSALPLCIVVGCVSLAAAGFASPRKVLNTLGTIVYALFLLLVLHALKPFRFIVHPSGEKSLLAMPSIVQGSEDHRSLIAVGILVLLVYCVSFLTICLWASWSVQYRSKPEVRLWYLESFRFLFFKFHPRAFYWGVLVLMRNTLIAIAPSLWPEHPVIAVFILAVLAVVSAAHTSSIHPWKAAWMNFVDVAILCYMALVLHLAAGWLPEDSDVSGSLSTALATFALFGATLFIISSGRFLGHIFVVGSNGRRRMREALSELEAEEITRSRAFFGAPTEVHDFFDMLIREATDHSAALAQHKPWLDWITKQECNMQVVESIMQKIRSPSYTANEFLEDCLTAFPEIQLYCLQDGQPDAEGSRKNLLVNGVSSAEEQQRTFGALLAIFWVCRLDMDGRCGMSFGVEEDRGFRVKGAPSKMEEQDSGLPWAKKDQTQRQQYFYSFFKWDLFVDLFQEAGILTVVDGAIQLDTSMEGRLVAMLSLTAYHDIMKDPKLCPTVRGEPYEGFQPGEEIYDHDLALAYILDRYPDLLPSYDMLTEEQQRSVRFTQSEMGFNAGWLVQAEGPPSAVLSKLKKVVSAGSATKQDVAFYFVHWVTDLAGAEPTPYRGSEKFAIKFPPQVLQSLLTCFHIVDSLALNTETEVYETYLSYRWQQASDLLGPEPTSLDRTARLRLHCMAQQNAKPLLDAFDRISAEDRRTLMYEMPETGLSSQEFSEWHTLGGPRVGTPFLLYYGPAWCQRAGQSHPELCLKVLAAVFRAARQAFPESVTKQKEEELEGVGCRTIQVGLLKTLDLDTLQHRMEQAPSFFRVTVKNRLEGELEVWAVMDV